MNEEKKLPDETVKDVAGGRTKQDIANEAATDHHDFINRNCLHCNNRQNCPYYGNADIAFVQLGGAPCPAYFGPKNPWHPDADWRPTL